MASFKESSELEFGADDAFMLTASDESGEIVLKHLKARHSEPCGIALRFNGLCQQFAPLETFPTDDFPIEPKGKRTAALANMWGCTNTADDDEEGGR